MFHFHFDLTFHCKTCLRATKTTNKTCLREKENYPTPNCLKTLKLQENISEKNETLKQMKTHTVFRDEKSQ